jgi:hypothetical protein
MTTATKELCTIKEAVLATNGLYKITIAGQSGTISWDSCNYKTMKGAVGAAKRKANEAFYGEQVEISIVPDPYYCK